MARKPQSFKLDEKNKVIILYTNVRIEAENELINFYLDRGYTPKYDEKKEATKVDTMRAELEEFDKANNTEHLVKFDEIYKTKLGKTATKEEKKKVGFFGACKYYTDWKKEQKKNEKAK